MKPSIVNSKKLQAYLASHKWIAHEEEHFIRYTPDLENIDVPLIKVQNKELLVPKEIVDRSGLYSIMDILWLTLSQIYDKTEKELVLEIEEPEKEIVSIRIADEDTQDGSISYNRLIDLMSSSKSIISENLINVYNPNLLHQINLKKIKSIFQDSKVIGIEQGSFILKLQMPSTIELKDKDMYDERVVVETIKSFDQAHKNINYFENEIINAVHSNTFPFERFVEENFQNIETNALSATFKMIDQFPKSTIEFSTASSKDHIFNINSAKYTKEGLHDIKNTITRVQEQQKKQERLFNGQIFDIIDDEIRTGQQTLSIHIKDRDKNSIYIPQIEMAYRSRLLEAMNKKHRIEINGLVKQETKTKFKVVHLKNISINNTK
ncbi:MAG: hypothetical protein ACRCTJ_05295 [Brevinema sp.]